MQTSTLRDNFTDHHLLYHLLLIPFTYIRDPLVGTKVATVFFSAIMVVGFYWLLKKAHTKWPFAFALLLLTLEGLNFRLTLVKVNSLSLLMIWVLIYALIQKKYWLMAVCSIIFVWLYGGWPLAIIILLAYLATDFFYQRLHLTRFKMISEKIFRWFGHGHGHGHSYYWKVPLYIILGLLIGLIANPYWPNNLYFYYQQVFQIGVVNLGQKFAVGSEWYGTGIMNIFSTMPHVVIIAGICFVILFYHLKKVRLITFFSFVLAFGFVLLNIKSKRYIEYSAPFTLLFAACAFTDTAKIITQDKVAKFWHKLPIYLKGFLLANLAVLLIVIMPLVINKTLNTKMPTNWPVDKFASSAQWLEQNTEPGSVIFHSDWDEWPSLFYHNDQNYYLIGLDFTFMYNYSPELQQEYIGITRGTDSQNIAGKIKNDFGASYIFVDPQGHDQFLSNLRADQNIIEVFQSSDSIIFKVLR